MAEGILHYLNLFSFIQTLKSRQSFLNYMQQTNIWVKYGNNWNTSIRRHGISAANVLMLLRWNKTKVSKIWCFRPTCQWNSVWNCMNVPFEINRAEYSQVTMKQWNSRKERIHSSRTLLLLTWRYSIKTDEACSHAITMKLIAIINCTKQVKIFHSL